MTGTALKPASVAPSARRPIPPLTDTAFAGLMAAVGPFEEAPHLAVAVSGGPDSMALVLLVEDWIRTQGGRVTALTVDHGFRPESAGEARRVGMWLKPRGIDHRVLRWRGPRPGAGLQAAAREARYRLMTAWCRDAGVLHLLLAHHREDQAETYLLRMERGSGPDGLAAMAAVVERPAVRLVRPLLRIPRARLRATLEFRRQEWIEDPSNRDSGFARVRVRALLSGPRTDPDSTLLLAGAARRAALERISLEGATSAWLARCCTVYPAGYARLNARALSTAPDDIRLRMLGRIVLCIGGASYAPRSRRLLRLHRSIADGGPHKGLTLGGCRILPVDGGLLVCREARGAPDPMAAVPGTDVLWDDRFLVTLAGTPDRVGVTRLTRLGHDGWLEIAADCPGPGTIPAAVRPTLPALRDNAGVSVVPHLDYKRGGRNPRGIAISRIVFHPRNALSPLGFALA